VTPADRRSHPRHPAPAGRAVPASRRRLAGRVQGEGSAAEVAAAIRGFNALAEGGAVPRPDLIIVARGGGIEDLWGSTRKSPSGRPPMPRHPADLGNRPETDTTLIDHAADHRAPTRPPPPNGCGPGAQRAARRGRLAGSCGRAAP
jgi:exodeoxyribonuclease VII large subunit